MPLKLHNYLYNIQAMKFFLYALPPLRFLLCSFPHQEPLGYYIPSRIALYLLLFPQMRKSQKKEDSKLIYQQ